MEEKEMEEREEKEREKESEMELKSNQLRDVQEVNFWLTKNVSTNSDHYNMTLQFIHLIISCRYSNNKY